jgi:predicted NUDIX family phosphoesterase
MAQEEKVLVVPRSVVEGVGRFQGVMPDAGRYIPILFAPGAGKYIPRGRAEKDSSHKQIIPYVIMRSAGKYLTYVRGKRAGETRLVEKRSIGIGGHINPADDMGLFDPYETYLNAVHREVEEEVHVQARYTERIIGLLNDDSNEVGSVHLGIVHLWDLDSPSVTRREQMITQMDFLTPQELLTLRDRMETWSQLCLDHLLAARPNQ